MEENIKAGDSVVATFWGEGSTSEPVIHTLQGIVQFMPSAPCDEWVIKGTDGSIYHLKDYILIQKG